MLVSETCVSAIALQSMQHPHPHVAFISLQLFLGMSGASFCLEQEQLDGITQNSQSQQACITALAPGFALNAETAGASVM